LTIRKEKVEGDPLMDRVLMAEMTSREYALALKETDAVIIPVGSTEVLGGHGPLGGDYYVASALGKKLGEMARCLVAPAVPFGDAEELRNWPGTISIPFDVLKGFYLAICQNFVAHGVKRIFFLNAHFMNFRAIDYCGRHLRRKGIIVSQGDWWRIAFSVADDLIESNDYPKGHGGEVITSVIMALRPELVHLSRAISEPPNPGLSFHGKYNAAGGGLFYTYPDFTDLCHSGGWGNPHKASIEKGEEIIRRSLAKLLDFLKEFRAQPLPEPVQSD
jgi:creatinine amidohydrolase